MKIRIAHTITRDHLLWATYHFARHGHPLSKKRILKYLRVQMEMFGSDEFSLMGSNDWREDDENRDFQRAAYFVDLAWPSGDW